MERRLACQRCCWKFRVVCSDEKKKKGCDLEIVFQNFFSFEIKTSADKAAKCVPILKSQHLVSFCTNSFQEKLSRFSDHNFFNHISPLFLFRFTGKKILSEKVSGASEHTLTSN